MKSFFYLPHLGLKLSPPLCENSQPPNLLAHLQALLPVRGALLLARSFHDTKPHSFVTPVWVWGQHSSFLMAEAVGPVSWQWDCLAATHTIPEGSAAQLMSGPLQLHVQNEIFYIIHPSLCSFCRYFYHADVWASSSAFPEGLRQRR